MKIRIPKKIVAVACLTSTLSLISSCGKRTGRSPDAISESTSTPASDAGFNFLELRDSDAFAYLNFYPKNSPQASTTQSVNLCFTNENNAASASQVAEVKDLYKAAYMKWINAIDTGCSTGNFALNLLDGAGLGTCHLTVNISNTCFRPHYKTGRKIVETCLDSSKNTALHELGHHFGLADTYIEGQGSRPFQPGSVMNSLFKTDLTDDDRNGITTIWKRYFGAQCQPERCLHHEFGSKASAEGLLADEGVVSSTSMVDFSFSGEWDFNNTFYARTYGTRSRLLSALKTCNRLPETYELRAHFQETANSDGSYFVNCFPRRFGFVFDHPALSREFTSLPGNGVPASVSPVGHRYKLGTVLWSDAGARVEIMSTTDTEGGPVPEKLARNAVSPTVPWTEPGFQLSLKVHKGQATMALIESRNPSEGTPVAIAQTTFTVDPTGGTIGLYASHYDHYVGDFKICIPYCKKVTDTVLGKILDPNSGEWRDSLYTATPGKTYRIRFQLASRPDSLVRIAIKVSFFEDKATNAGKTLTVSSTEVQFSPTTWETPQEISLYVGSNLVPGDDFFVDAITSSFDPVFDRRQVGPTLRVFTP